jgi:two-component system LytT family response regulator
MKAAELRVLIVDDEEPARRRIVELLRATAPEASITEAASGRQALLLLQSSHQDLVFLDVQMPELSGVQVLGTVGSESMPLTIFVTAFDRHAIEAFEANALDYLVKPYSDERFEAALERAKTRLRELTLSRLGRHVLQVTSSETARKRYLERLAVKVDGGTRLIASLEVESFEAAGVYVTLHSKGREYLYRGTLNKLSEDLDPDKFVRVHRSTIVNIAAIVLLEPTSHGEFEASLRSGRHVQVSRTFRGDLEQRLQQVL